MRNVSLIPGLTQWVKDPAFLWLWCSPTAVTQSQPLGWELPYAAGVALEKKKKSILSGLNPHVPTSGMSLTTQLYKK